MEHAFTQDVNQTELIAAIFLLESLETVRDHGELYIVSLRDISNLIDINSWKEGRNSAGK